MKYLVIEEKRINPHIPLRIIRKYYPKVKFPRTKKGKLQFFFPQNQLTKENVEEISRKLCMEIIKLSDERAVIGY